MTWEYFNYDLDPMLACPCCGERKMDVDFMNALDDMRAQLGEPFAINSGYRCSLYNAQISSTGGTGPHTYGRAVDIAADSRLKFLILEAAIRWGWTRIGIGKNFIHIDNLGEAEGFSEKVIWTYG